MPMGGGIHVGYAICCFLVSSRGAALPPLVKSEFVIILAKKKTPFVCFARNGYNWRLWH
jgi:hypothetical protein